MTGTRVNDQRPQRAGPEKYARFDELLRFYVRVFADVPTDKLTMAQVCLHYQELNKKQQDKVMRDIADRLKLTFKQVTNQYRKSTERALHLKRSPNLTLLIQLYVEYSEYEATKGNDIGGVTPLLLEHEIDYFSYDVYTIASRWRKYVRKGKRQIRATSLDDIKPILDLVKAEQARQRECSNEVNAVDIQRGAKSPKLPIQQTETTLQPFEYTNDHVNSNASAQSTQDIEAQENESTYYDLRFDMSTLTAQVDLLDERFLTY